MSWLCSCGQRCAGEVVQFKIPYCSPRRSSRTHGYEGLVRGDCQPPSVVDKRGRWHAQLQAIESAADPADASDRLWLRVRRLAPPAAGKPVQQTAAGVATFTSGPPGFLHGVGVAFAKCFLARVKAYDVM